ncbi:MAG TPA: hypothetical protein VIM30_01285 [Candidatus Limnocylindrales bacterium]|jgi:hypothetical protein
MTAEFDWWLLIVGLVVGAGVVWLVLADWSRSEEDVAEAELSVEAELIASRLAEAGHAVDPATAHEVLREHRAYLAGSPPDWVEAVEQGGVLGEGRPASETELAIETELPSEASHRIEPQHPIETEHRGAGQEGLS